MRYIASLRLNLVGNREYLPVRDQGEGNYEISSRLVDDAQFTFAFSLEYLSG